MIQKSVFFQVLLSLRLEHISLSLTNTATGLCLTEVEKKIKTEKQFL